MARMARQSGCATGHWLFATLFMTASVSYVLGRSLLAESNAADAVTTIMSVPLLVSTGGGKTDLLGVNRRGLAECNGDEDNVDFLGNDIGGGCETRFQNTAECCLLCATTLGCTSWSWLKPTAPSCPTSCWLKNSDAGRVAEANAVSGYVYFSEGSQPIPQPPPTVPKPPPTVPQPPPPVPQPPPPVPQPPPTFPQLPPGGLGGGGGGGGGGACTDSGAVVARHNEVRSRHEATNGLTWADDLAATAQAHAHAITTCDQLFHSSGGGYGENIASGYGTGGIGDGTCAAAVGAWYHEVNLFDFNNYAANLEYSRLVAAGHFTQVVWRSTTQVGCGQARCTSSDGYGGQVTVCQYREQGNYADLESFLANIGRLL